MAQRFHRVETLSTPDGLVLVYWRMEATFNSLGGDVNFYVDWARSAGDWTCLNATAPVVNGCMYVDPVKRNFNMIKNLYYRVRAVFVTSSSIESLPVQALGSLTDEEYLYAKEIIRINYVALKKRGGVHGFLLKRREWGTVCPTCADWDMDEATRGSCPTCFGTGISLGYYPGMDYWVNSQPREPRKRQTDAGGLGVVDPNVRVVYGVAYPWVDALDLWVESKSNERWIIRTVKHRADMGSKPIFFDMELHKLPETSPAMAIPISGAGESFHDEIKDCPPVEKPFTAAFPIDQQDRVNSTLEADRGWRKGLADQNF